MHLLWGYVACLSSLVMISSFTLLTQCLTQTLFVMLSHHKGQSSDWLISRDTLQICPDNEKIVQIFVLAHIYYSTNGDGWIQESSRPGGLQTLQVSQPSLTLKSTTSHNSASPTSGPTASHTFTPTLKLLVDPTLNVPPSYDNVYASKMNSNARNLKYLLLLQNKQQSPTKKIYANRQRHE